jgi:hypothetical protein
MLALLPAASFVNILPNAFDAPDGSLKLMKLMLVF